MNPLPSLALCCAALMCQTTQAQPATAWPQPDWAVSEPEAQGMDSAALVDLVAFGASASMDSLVVVRHGRIVAEAYYAPFRPGMKHRINSATKAVVSALAGIAIGRGELPGTGASVAQLLGEPATAGLSNGISDGWKAITLQHLLDMTTGISWTEPLAGGLPETLVAMERSPDWGRFILSRPMAQAPGATFNYNSGASHIVSMALARRTGMPTQAYAAQHLFKPLGIADYRWRTDPQGTAIGGFGLYMQTRDMAKMGLLYLNRGQWDGQQVVPAAWAGRAFAASVPMGPGMGELTYADYWWTLPSRKAIMAAGYLRQLIIVLPDIGVVAAMTGRDHYPFEAVIDRLRNATKATDALPPNAAAAQLLRQRMAEVAQEKATPTISAPALQQSLNGTTWQLDANRLAIDTLTLELQTTPPVYRLKVRPTPGRPLPRELVRPLGLDGKFVEGTEDGTPILGKATWRDATTLQVDHRWPEEASSATYVLKFSGDRVEIEYTGSLMGRAVLAGVVKR